MKEAAGGCGGRGGLWIKYGNAGWCCDVTRLIKKQKLTSKLKRMAVTAEIVMLADRYAARLGTMKHVQTHVGAGVQEHVRINSNWNLSYDVSKHFETKLHVICSAVSLSTIVMTPPHVGQTQDETGRAFSVGRITGAIPNSWRQRSSDEDR